MKRFSKFLIIAFLLPAVSLFAEYNRFNVPDSAEIRKDLVDTWFTEPIELIRLRNPEIRTNSIGQRFQVRCEESEDFFSIFVSPETEIPIDVYTDSGVNTITKTEYPIDICGSWVLVRNKSDGSPIRIRYYFSADSDVYIQLTPFSRYTLADMVIFKNYASRGLQLGLPFERFYSSSFEQLYKWTSSILPWNYVTINTSLYHSNLQMIQVIRENLPSIVYTDDAIYDEAGRPIYLSTGKPRKVSEENRKKLTLNEAGFVKWVVDGLIYPITGSYTFRDPLLVPTVEFKPVGFQGIIDSVYDLSFSLNWTRNLAAASLSVFANKKYLYSESGVDVTNEPFCAELIDGKIVNNAGYIKDTGYEAGKLKAILYVLAATNPSFCYLSAIRSNSQTTPEVRPFNHCAVLFPYFDSNGRFDCVVFANGTEVSLSYFLQRYKNDFIHLTRIETEDRFFPQTAAE
ncbi:MAG: hypothetical protein K5640_05215 [Treponema sp.]|nr:hypothetical protein [Treponema sp.]